jgi:hypothetical protein
MRPISGQTEETSSIQGSIQTVKRVDGENWRRGLRTMGKRVKGYIAMNRAERTGANRKNPAFKRSF